MMKSPGQATSERDQLERRWTRRARPLFAGFLTQVRTLALNPDGVQPFRQAAVERLYFQFVQDFTDDPDLQQALLDTDLPGEVYQAARETLTAADTQGWTRQELAEALSEVLDPEDGSQQTLTASGRDKAREAMAAFGHRWGVQIDRILRTQATGAAGRNTLAALIEEGVRYKQWVAHHDDITRDTHLAADGQKVPVEGYFQVGPDQLRYCADPLGSYAEIANCRCVIVGRAS